MTCDTCRFYASTTETCRRHAPIPIGHVHHAYDEGNWNDPPTITTTIYSHFPEVAKDDWCGEWAPSDHKKG